MGVKRRLYLSFSLLALLMPFQNCTKFQSTAKDLLSKQCAAKFRADVVASLHLRASDLSCGDFNRYACERRIFSPDVTDLTEQIKECITNTICVDVDVRQFNTSAARSDSNSNEFLPGGSYNHEEDNCYHRISDQGMVLFVGSGDSLEESLSKAMAACEQGVGS